MKKLLWCPVDVPPVPNKEKLIKELTSNSESGSFYFWKYFKITDERPAGSGPYDVCKIKEDFKQKFPELVEWIELFPYKSIRNIKVNLQEKEVIPHCDFHKPDLEPALWENNTNNDPCGYRIILSGYIKNKLYLWENKEKIYCNMPEGTDTYVLNHASGEHGVEDDENRYTLFMHLEIDPEKHNLLMERSLTKYGEHAIYA
jgi:hypothetical protein